MKKSIWLILGCIVIAVIMFARCNYADNTVDQMKLQKMNEFQRSLDKPISYFGLVVDQQNTPVSNASVKIQIGQASGVNTKLYSTDNNGIFEVAGINGSDFLITDINLPGYEFLDSNRAHTGYENDGSKVIDRSHPVLFTLRKKEPPTVVIPGDLSVVYAKDVKFYEVDLKQMVDDKPFGLRRYHGDNAHADIKTKLEYSSVDDSYTFILETPDADSGIIALDQLLYALPETGYKTPFKIKVPNNQSATTYLYVKSRGGQLYSRLDVKFAIEKEKVYFAAKVLTNPLGERNVDSDSDKYKEYLDKQDAEAKRMGTKPQ